MKQIKNELKLRRRSSWVEGNIRKMKHTIEWSKQKVGQIESYLFDTALVGEDLFYAMDFNGDIIHAYFSLYIEGITEEAIEQFDQNTYIIPYKYPLRMVYLDTIEIDKDDRGHGYFKKAMDLVLTDFKKNQIDYVILGPSPYERGEYGTFLHKSEEERERIARFYGSLGFKKTEGRLPKPRYYMVKSLLE